MNRLNRTWCFPPLGLLLLFSWVLLQTASAQVNEGKIEEVSKGTINLLVGQERTIKMKVTQMSIGNAEIAKVAQLADLSGVLISAKSAGTTQMRLWPQDQVGTIFVYTINVSAQDIDELMQEVQALLGSMLGVELKKVGQKLVLDGTVLKSADRNRINQIIEEYGLLDLTENKFSELEELEKQREIQKDEEAIIEAIKADLNSQGLTRVEVEMKTVRDERKLYLTGTVFNNDHLDRALKIAKIYYPDDEKITNLIKVENPVVEIELQLASVDQDKAKEVGSNTVWNELMRLNISEILYDSQSNAWTNPTFTIAPGGANAALRLLKTEGATKFYAQQAQSVKSGFKAEFNQGGEIFFTTQGENPTLDKVEFGFQADVTPVVEVDGNVTLEVEVINSSVSDQGVEGAAVSLDKFETKSTMEVMSGQSVVLSGIDGNTSIKTESKTPILGSIPIINLLFKAKNKSSNNFRTVLILTPTETKYFGKLVPDLTATAQEDAQNIREETTTKKLDKVKEADPEAPETVENKFDQHKEKKHPWWKFWKWH